MKVEDLKGALLDYWAAAACEAWTTAHEHFPTMTLDPTFSGLRFVTFASGETACYLVPRNPMRQDPQRYSPSTLWEHGGPIIERLKLVHLPDPNWHGGIVGTEEYLAGTNISIEDKTYSYGSSQTGQWTDHDSFFKFEHGAHGSTPLIAAMRSLVKSKFGAHVPDEIPPEPV